MTIEAHFNSRIQRIEKYLSQCLTSDNNANPILEAMRYSVLNGGKRLRPLLVYLTGEALGYSLNQLDAPAAAVELIHCYSLIHDDLPAMDNDDLRRGKPTCHKAFNEATAILAGDALQTRAFQILSDPSLNPCPPEQQINMIQLLAKNSGVSGMVGGQALDLQATGLKNTLSLEALCRIHQLKTGALIEASVLLGTLAQNKTDSKANPEISLKLQMFAHFLGLSFQVQDDILDIEGNVDLLGKTIGKDSAQNKATFPALLGLDAAKQYAEDLHQKALESIAFLNETGTYLTQLAERFIHRLS